MRAKKKPLSIWTKGTLHRSKDRTDTKVSLIDKDGKEIESTYVNYMYFGVGLDENPTKEALEKRPDGTAVVFFKMSPGIEKILIYYKGKKDREILVDSIKEVK